MTYPHGQVDARVRMEWGPVGADTTLIGARFAVVVDVLSFTTTVSVALDVGAEVHPYRWADDSAVQYARELDAILAVGRLEARRPGNVTAVSLSPSTVRTAQRLTRLVLPSPNGSTISARLAATGVHVVAASLRNHTAVAAWLAERLGSDASAAVTVVAAGERWPDGSLRPAVEDLWGAGAVVAGLRDTGIGPLSPEARVAAAAFGTVRARLGEQLAQCSSGRELTDAGFGDDVSVAAELAASNAVPLLVGDRFVDASTVSRS